MSPFSISVHPALFFLVSVNPSILTFAFLNSFLFSPDTFQLRINSLVPVFCYALPLLVYYSSDVVHSSFLRMAYASLRLSLSPSCNIPRTSDFSVLLNAIKNKAWMLVDLLWICWTIYINEIEVISVANSL